MTPSRSEEPRREAPSTPSMAAPEAVSQARTAPGPYWDYCPNCSARLYNVGCKYRCPRCHYFMSCSDFD